MNTSTNTNTKFLISFLVGTIIACVVIYKFSFNRKKNIFTCNKFLTNTYLYLVLSLLIMSLLMTILLHFNVEFEYKLKIYLIFFLASIFLIFIKHSIVPDTPSKMIVKHLVWLILLLVFAFQLIGMIKRTSRDTVLKSVVTSGILVLILTLFAHYKSNLISLSMGPVLFVLLLTLIIFELVSLLFFRDTFLSGGMNKMFSIGAICLFMTFILYETKVIREKAKTCVIADYIKESFSLYLDILNIFVRSVSLR